MYVYKLRFYIQSQYWKSIAHETWIFSTDIEYRNAAIISSYFFTMFEKEL